MPQNVILNGPAPWGFRLAGGKDFKQPLTISRVTPGSKASLVNLCPGDIILAIDGAASEGMTHAEAQNKIRDATQKLCLKIERPQTKLWSPQVTEEGEVNPFKVNLQAEPQDLGYFEHKFNVRPKPFTPALHGSVPQGQLGHVVQAQAANPSQGEALVPSAQYNSPLALYSHENATHAPGGRQPLPSGKALTSMEESHVYRMLQDNEERPSAPRQSGSFRALQDYVESDGTRPIVTRSVKAPVTKPQTAAGSLQKLPLCGKCGKGIVGTVVKVRDKFRHPGCFVCCDCGINLKQQGFFLVEGLLYCETHARARTTPPQGHDLVTVYPNA